ncbi:Carboxypeptidase Y inhibitor protein [Rutstroemia sp. NJR-2017a BVV2]|nr:Carboxypeptidase Y inhibitor protein [Rutstroemia sp. NJR-2017a BVV2]
MVYLDEMQPFTLLCLLTAVVEFGASLAVFPKSDGTVKSKHGSRDWSLKGVQKILKGADIIDDVLDNFTPTCYIAPYYETKKVKYGNTIKPGKTEEAPSVHIFCPGKTEVSGLTIALTDPDAPSRDDDSMSEMCHWIAKVPSVVIGRDLVADFNATDLFAAIDYKAPAPPEGTDKHRYVFVLLEGPNVNLTVPEERKHWGFEKPGSGVRDWADQENLTVIGANFHYEKHQEKKSDSLRFKIQPWY